MGSADPVDDRTFNGDFSEEGAAKLKERVKVKLKEYMGDYTDDILVEYVIVLLKNGRKKVEANNELKIFLADDSDSFVAWLWDHLAESMDEYFSISSHNEDKPLVQMDSDSVKGRSGARRDRGWRSQVTDVPDVPPLLSSEVHKIHDYEKRDHRERRGKRSPSPQSEARRKRSKPDSSRNEQMEAKANVSSRLLQFAMRDALAISKPAEPSLKRLRSVVSASTQDASDTNPPQKIRSSARVANPMATVIKAVAEDAEDAKNPKSGRSVFDRISHSTGFSETLDQHMVLGEVSPKNEVGRNFSEDQEHVQHQYTQRVDNNGMHVENMATFNTGSQPNFSSDRSRLGSNVNVSHPTSLVGNRIKNPRSLQDRLVDDPRRVKGTNYQNHLTEVATNQKAAGFSGSSGTGKTVKLEEQMKVPDVGLQRYMDRGRVVSSVAFTASSTIGSGSVKPGASTREDTAIKKSVSGTLSTTRPVEDASCRTIFVANVHFGATKDSLSRHFNKCGEVLKAVIVTDPATGQPSGSAYIEFTRKEAADNALSLDGTSFMSRILKIVKGSNGQQQQQEAASWARAGRYARASPYRRGSIPGAFRGRPVVRAGGARSMQWKRDSSETGNSIAAPSTRSMTYVRTESQPDGHSTV